MELIQDKEVFSVHNAVKGRTSVIAGSKKKESNHLFPVFLKAENLRLLIVGGGCVAMEKLQAVLTNAPAAVIKIVAIHISDDIKLKASLYPNIHLEEHPFLPADLQNTDWVIVAVNNKDESSSIRNMAKAARLLVNVADMPNLCDFYLGSVIQKGSLKIGISTNGKSPTIAKRLKEILRDAIPDELENVLDNMHQIRETLKGDFAAKVKTLNDITSTFVFGKR